MPASGKRYDRDYFDRWYRHPRFRVIHRSRLERKVRLALSACEYLTGRRVRRVLDVGCGEAPWRAVLKRVRPGVRYVGIESSPYVLSRFGRRRGIREGRIGTLGRLGLKGPFDLVVVADVLHYLEPREVRRGLVEVSRLLGGVAFIETYAREDSTVGDDEDYQSRGAAWYRRALRDAGLAHVGLHCFVGKELAGLITSFESGALTRRSR